MKKKKQKKFLTIIIVIVLCFMAITFSMININNNTNFILKDVTTFLNKLTTAPFLTKKSDQTESYLIQKNINKELEEEIEELKQVLKLNNSLSEYDIENATVLSRNKSYWLNTLIIDKGKKSNIKENMVVVTSKGMIGLVSKVYNTSSEIKLLTADDKNNKISVSIKVGDNDTYGILSGYDKDNNLIKITEVDKSVDIKEKESVITSGLSKYIPRGIYIGEVEKIETDKYNLSKNLYVKTDQDFNSIHYVTVLKEKK